MANISCRPDASALVLPRRYRPLVPIAAALAAGIFLADRLGGGLNVWLIISGVCAAIWFFLFRFRRANFLAVGAVLALVLAAGGVRYHLAVGPPGPHDVSRLIGQGRRITTLTGIVLDEPRTTYPPPGVYFAVPDYVITSKFRLRVEHATIEGRDYDADGRVAVRIRGRRVDAGRLPEAGDRVEVVGLLSGIRPPANPGELDLARFYHRIGVGAMLWTHNWEAVKITAPAADGVRHWLGEVRRFALKGFELVPDARSRGVLEAIVLGRRDRLEETVSGEMPEEELEQAFVKTGTAHFLAISGLHVGMMAAFVAFVLRALLIPRRASAIVVILFVIFYAVLADFRPSVVRASVATAVACLGWLLGRRSDLMNSLAGAVVLILLVSPVDLFTVGFQLSFLVAFGLLLVGPKIEGRIFRRSIEAEALSDEPFVPSRFHRLKRWLRRAVCCAIVAPLVSYPYVAYRFHFVTLMGPMVTILAFFLVFPILVLGFGMILTGWWVVPLAQLIWECVVSCFSRVLPFYHPVAILGVLMILIWQLLTSIGTIAADLCSWLVSLLGVFSRLPYTFSYVRGFAWPWLFAIYGTVALWVWRERLRISRRRLALVALSVAAAFGWFGLPAIERDGVCITFLSVGSANINLIQLPNARNILYDAGASYSSTRATAYSIAPALWARAVDRVDAVFVSHPHFDHFKEILQIAERFRIGRVYVPRSFMRADKQADDLVVKDVLARGIPVEYIGVGQTLAGLGDVQLDVLWPTDEVDEDWTVNDGSLVVRITYSGRSVLLTGDIEAAGIEALLRRGVPKCDVVLWPHHGVPSESVERLFEQTGCKTVVISASPRLAHKEQNPVTDLPYRLYHTGFDGTVTVDLRPEGVEVETFRGGRATANQR